MATEKQQSDLCTGARAQQGKGTPPPSQGLTLAEYAEAKKIPLQFLEQLGLQTCRWSGASHVVIPYADQYGVIKAVRYRHKLHKPETGPDDRFSWKKGTTAMPYGLWALDEAKKQGQVLLVEGESDSQTLWLYRLPALGIPGADMFKPEWASYLNGLKVYAWHEPDHGGEVFIKTLAKHLDDFSVLTPSDGIKDISEAHIAGQDIPALIGQLIKDAKSVGETKAKEKEATTEEAWAKCAELAQKPDILACLEELLPSLSYAGDATNLKIVYLALTSRLLDKILSIILRGPSGAGKSYQAETVLRLFPEDAYYLLTGLSEKALAFGQEDISHKVLVIYELAALNSDFGSYLLRSLLSEGRVCYEVVVKTEDGLECKRLERPGPTGVILTSTATHIDKEVETRLLALTVTDTAEQTKLVLETLANRSNGHAPVDKPDLSEWVELQRWLQLAGRREVSIPYAGILARLCDARAVRMRRDFSQLLSLIKAHALLHQATREVTERDQVLATVADYAAVHALIAVSFGEQLALTVRPETREVVQTVKSLIEAGKGTVAREKEPPSVSSSQVTAQLQLDRSAVSRRLSVAASGGYLRNLETRKGQPARWVLGDELPGEKTGLPTPDQVQEAWGVGVSIPLRTHARVHKGTR